MFLQVILCEIYATYNSAITMCLSIRNFVDSFKWINLYIPVEISLVGWWNFALTPTTLA